MRPPGPSWTASILRLTRPNFLHAFARLSTDFSKGQENGPPGMLA
jgi:hypothetical protein